MLREHKLVSNSLYLFLDWLCVTLFGFLFWTAIGKTLPPAQYGIIVISLNLLVMLSDLSTLGLGRTCYKLIPEYLESGREEKIKPLIKFSTGAVLLFNLFMALLMLFLSPNLAALLRVPTEAILMSAAGLVIFPFTQLFGHVLGGFQRMRKIFLTDLAGQLVKLGLALLLVFWLFSYVGPIIAFLTGFLITALLRLEPAWFTGSAGVERKEIGKYAMPALVSALTLVIFMNMSYVLLPILHGSETTGIFAFAMTITTLIPAIPNVLAQALFPLTSGLSAKSNPEEAQARLIDMILRYTTALLTPPVALFVIFRRELVLIFSGPEYLPAADLIPPLTLAGAALGYAVLFLTSLYAMRRPKINRNIWAFSGVLFVTLSVPLTYHFSLLGLILSYLLAVASLLSLGYLFLRRRLPIFPVRYVRKALPAGLSFIFILIGISWLRPTFWIETILVALAVALYFCLLLFLRFFESEDVKNLEFLASRCPVFGRQLAHFVRFVSKFT